MNRRAMVGSLRTAIQSQRLAAALIAGLVAAVFLVPAFATPLNVSQLLTQISINGVMVVGMTALLICGGVDLSIGSTLALCAVVYSMCAGQGIAVALGAAVLVGLLVGMLNGLLVTVARINFFIATLATMVGVRGLALTIANGQTIYSNAPGFTSLGAGGITVGPFQLEAPALIFLGTAVIGTLLMSRTQGGRNVYALGGNRHAAFLAGVPVRRTFFLAFALMGALAGLAGALLASRLSSGSPALGTDTPLVVIAAAVLGGTSIYGGVGSVPGAVLGLVFLGVIDNALVLLAVPSFYGSVIRGALLILVVVIDAQVARRHARAAATAARAAALRPASEPAATS